MKFEIDGLKEFMNALDNAANGGLREEMILWLDVEGFNFLDLIQDEIIKAKSVESRDLLNSFTKGDSENIWVITEGGLSLEIGTRLRYADFVNSGHHQKRRWVPGRWIAAGEKQRFEYTPGADTGMMLTEKWVEGSHYWDFAFAMFEKVFAKDLEHKLQEWIDKTF